MTIYASVSENEDELSLTSNYHDSEKVGNGVVSGGGGSSPKIGQGKLLKQAASAVKNRVGKDGGIGPSPRNGHGEMSKPFALSAQDNGDEGNDAICGSGSSNDPYFVVRDDLMRQLSLAEEAVSAYINVVENTDSAANSHQVKEKKKQYKRHMKHSDSTLKDLQSTITMVESNRDQFSSIISDQELHKRKLFVNDMKGRVRSLKDDINSDKLRQKIMQDERTLAERRKSQKELKSNNKQQNRSPATNRESESSLLANDSNSHDALARDEEMGQHVQAQQMLKRQDETLDDLDHAVVRVGQMAGSINDELQTQSKMLTSLEEDLSDAEEKLGMVMGKLAKMLKTKSKCQLGTIMLLSVTVVILFFLVIYT